MWNDLPLAEIRYDAAFVADRDESLALERAAHRALEPLTALIGFLWTAPKARLELGYGISARRATWLSIGLQIATAFFFAVCHSVSTDTRRWPLPPPLLALATTLLAADAVEPRSHHPLALVRRSIGGGPQHRLDLVLADVRRLDAASLERDQERAVGDAPRGLLVRDPRASRHRAGRGCARRAERARRAGIQGSA